MKKNNAEFMLSLKIHKCDVGGAHTHTHTLAAVIRHKYGGTEAGIKTTCENKKDNQNRKKKNDDDIKSERERRGA